MHSRWLRPAGVFHHSPNKTSEPGGCGVGSEALPALVLCRVWILGCCFGLPLRSRKKTLHHMDVLTRSKTRFSSAGKQPVTAVPSLLRQHSSGKHERAERRRRRRRGRQPTRLLRGCFAFTSDQAVGKQRSGGVSVALERLTVDKPQIQPISVSDSVLSRLINNTFASFHLYIHSLISDFPPNVFFFLDISKMLFDG